MRKFHRRKKRKTLRGLILLKAIFTAYRKTPETEEILKTLEKDEEKTDFRRIRCPLCRWRRLRRAGIFLRRLRNALEYVRNRRKMSVLQISMALDFVP
jgi:hypothetical protein